MASFLAATAQWRLAALPIASCGLKLDKEAARVAVGLRLGLDLCVPTFAERQCGSPVDARGLHSLVCKQTPGRSSRYHMLNDLVARAFVAVGIPVAKETVGLVRQDGKRPDYLTLNPIEGGRSLTWDVTVVCSTADYYIDLAVQGPGCVAEMASSRKVAKPPLCRFIMTSSRSQSRSWVLSIYRLFRNTVQQPQKHTHKRHSKNNKRK